MKRKILVLIVVSLLIMTGCFNSKNSEKTTEKKESNTTEVKQNQMVGSYILASAKEGEKTYTKEEINKIKSNFRIIVHDNSQAEFYSNGSQYVGTYDENRFIVETGEGKNKKTIEAVYKYNIDNKTIAISTNSGVYEFTKE